MKTKTVDSAGVVIVCVGIAGLTTAAYLSRAGLKVDVYEQHTLPGGYISSFVREGFTFPAGPTSITSNGIVFPILSELGLAGKRHFIHVGHQMSWGEHDIPFMAGKFTWGKRSKASRMGNEEMPMSNYPTSTRRPACKKPLKSLCGSVIA